jgi:serine/threonine protein kinase
MAICLQIMYHVALRLQDLHKVGYVHRDLKPANVMWLPRQNRWTVIDFGLVARIGQTARLGFSFDYAAPEVISAYRLGAVTMDAQVRIQNCFQSAAQLGETSTLRCIVHTCSIAHAKAPVQNRSSLGVSSRPR